MSTYESNGHFFARDFKVIIPQLVMAAATMQHIDELLQQLAYAIVQRFNIPLVQFWTDRENASGHYSIQLRTLARQDASLPEHLVVNDHIAQMASNIARERRGSNLQSVEAIFSTYQSSLLKRYGLHYCISYFLARNVLLPSRSGISPQEDSPVLFAMTVWLFLRQIPPQTLQSSIAIILEQAIIVAENHGLLLPVGAKTSQLADPQAALQQKALPELTELIPRRKHQADLLLSSNPFAHSPAISDKKARHFHAAIDGHTSVASLCRATDIDKKEAFAILRMLFAQNSIELYTPDGQLIEALPPLSNQ